MNYFISSNISELTELQNALSLISKNNWEAAHEIAQKKEGDPAYDRIHALLHRIEGDKFNAKYWYSRIGEKMPNTTFQEETEELKIAIKKVLKELK